MKHFAAEEWSDFVNHVDCGDRVKAMQEHRGTGRKRYVGTVALWQRVANAAAVEASYQPAAESVRVVKAAFATAGWAAQAAGNRRLDPTAVRQLLAAGPSRRALRCHENKTDALPGRALSDRYPDRSAAGAQSTGRHRTVVRREPSGDRWSRRASHA